jgi:hypothetical protein
LCPQVSIAFDPNGNLLDTAHAQPTDFDVWMQAHAAAMVKYAQLAQQTGVKRYVVISDQVQLLTFDSGHTAGFLDLIAQVPSVYFGQITSMFSTNGRYLYGLRGQLSDIDLTDRRIIDALDVLDLGFYYCKGVSQPCSALLASTGLMRRRACALQHRGLSFPHLTLQSPSSAVTAPRRGHGPTAQGRAPSSYGTATGRRSWKSQPMTTAFRAN